jgi:hypothetical protein
MLVAHIKIRQPPPLLGIDQRDRQRVLNAGK